MAMREVLVCVDDDIRRAVEMLHDNDGLSDLDYIRMRKALDEHGTAEFVASCGAAAEAEVNSSDQLMEECFWLPIKRTLLEEFEIHDLDL